MTSEGNPSHPNGKNPAQIDSESLTSVEYLRADLSPHSREQGDCRSLLSPAPQIQGNLVSISITSKTCPPSAKPVIPKEKTSQALC